MKIVEVEYLRNSTLSDMGIFDYEDVNIFEEE